MNRTLLYFGKCSFFALFSLVALDPALAQDKLVEDANTVWNSYFNKGDAHGLAALYDEKAIVSPGNGKTVQGREDIEMLFKGYFDAGVHDHTTDVVRANRIGNVMYETANWSAVLEKDGKKTQFKGVLLKVMMKGTDGKWRTTAHTWNAEENK
ncbi:SgcJ/EcaC family oxidoreductase [Burkholderia sp. Ac-20365]|uniref:YybH family protein n=1 Tax=Burkholderia sp. Ac-20365 TaxID=2703897 RepID=UPI00197C5180|nr:SgcJ/EcaC family oxidoreductase [Burkholderia sp. Ac-20365]MBN3759401.1 SgcJ/EcaC family oxidoreductase [Burkholderia sp. Ac-20365]